MERKERENPKKSTMGDICRLQMLSYVAGRQTSVVGLFSVSLSEDAISSPNGPVEQAKLPLSRPESFTDRASTHTRDRS